MTTVCCVHWGTKFPIEYVYNLKSAVERNTTKEHNFVVFSDRKIKDVETKILLPGYEGWWNKLQMFNPTNRLGRRAIYFDLDTLITGNLDWLFDYDGNMMGIEDVGAVNAHQPHLKNVFQSGVMSWNPLMMGHIWTRFNPAQMGHVRGDGEYMHSYLNPLQRDLLQHKYPNKLKSYKYQVYPNKPDKKTAIVCFHGRPSIIEAQRTSITTPMATYKPQNWIAEYWR
jgi:hypothetical protein